MRTILARLTTFPAEELTDIRDRGAIAGGIIAAGKATISISKPISSIDLSSSAIR